MNNLQNNQKSNAAPMGYDTLLAVVNSKAVDTWLEPYIGSAVKIIKRGIKTLWFEMDYGYVKKCKADSSLFNYC